MIIVVAAAACVPMLGSRQAVARVQQAPSSRVTLDLPDGYKPTPQFSGFVDEQHGVSIVIVEMPAAAYEQVVKTMTAEALATKGVLKAQAAKLKRPEPYIYMQATQSTDEGQYAKYLVAFRQDGATALVTANVRKTALDQGEITEAAIEQILASAAIAPVAAPAREVFALDYLGPFKAAGTLLGTTRAFTLDGRMEPSPSKEPRAILIVAPSLDRRPVPEPETYAEKLLDGLPGIKSPKIAERQLVKLAGLDAVEIVGTATDADSGKEISIYQAVLLSPGGGYFRIVGQMPIAERDRLLPEFRRIAKAFRPVE